MLAMAGLMGLAGAATAAEPPHSDSLLWRVEADGGAPSYVFGTMHSDRQEVLELPARVESAFEGAQRYAFELDFGPGMQTKVAQAMMATSGSSLQERMDAKSWEQLKSVAQDRGLPPSGLSQFEPWAIAVTLAMPQIQPQQSLDWVLHGRAQDKGAPVTGLETVDEQMSVFDEIPEDKQIEALEKVVALRAAGDLAELQEQTAKAWLDEDLARLLQISENNPMMPDPTSEKALKKRLVEDRNNRMAARMQSLIDKGGAFIAIGALHLPGEKGVLQQLEDAGYAVSAVRD
jgi:uncharacterized protein YbaP (TraB family)